MALHFAFIGYLVFGGFVAWRWPRTLVLHVGAVVWGIGSVLVGYECPLTWLQNWARESDGRPPLPSSGFIAHYLTGVVYPESAVNLVRLLVVVVIVGSWVGCVRRVRHAWSAPHPVS
ncbi:DUF2784 domain-containing protein [Rhodococcus gannanensis]|uniref:DUF2784 domain-containing protein n=1 Tax=Rhodococcus gannanensis TaxID=1960308 RepID=A0ABW4P1K9_9NOCA